MLVNYDGVRDLNSRAGQNRNQVQTVSNRLVTETAALRFGYNKVFYFITPQLAGFNVRLKAILGWAAIMNVRLCKRPVLSINQLRLLSAASLLSFASICCAGPADEPFYHQLIDLNDRPGYQPTRSFTIVTDAENGNRLVAEDDPDLRFNIMWMDQYQPGYRMRKNGAAFGHIIRGYAKSLYKSYRSNQAGSNDFLPSAEGTGSVGNLTDTDYDLRISDDEVKVGVKYTY